LEEKYIDSTGGVKNMFLQSDDNTTAIESLIRRSDKLDCAVAFLGNKAESLLPKNNSDVRIVCNLNSGGTNPSVVEKLMANGRYKLKHCPELHAKVYIGNEAAIVSSANLSANGLGLDADELNGWIEAGYEVTDPEELKTIHTWFSNLWKESKKILATDIENAKHAWEKRRIIRPVAALNSSLLDELKKNPWKLENRNIYLVISTDIRSPEANNTLKSIRKGKEYGLNVDAYEDWDALPENSYFIDLYRGPRGGFGYYGLLKSPEKKILISFKNREKDEVNLYLCHKQADLFGYTITDNDKELLRERVDKLLDAKIGDGSRDEGKHIELTVARKILFPKA